MLVPDVRVRRTATFPQAKSAAAAEMARGSFGEVAHVELMEQGVCNVVHGNTVNQRAAYVRRLAAVGLTLLAAAVVCAALVGGSTPGANQVSACARSWPGGGGGAHLGGVSPPRGLRWLRGPRGSRCPGCAEHITRWRGCRAFVVAWGHQHRLLTFPCVRCCVVVRACAAAGHLKALLRNWVGFYLRRIFGLFYQLRCLA